MWGNFLSTMGTGIAKGLGAAGRGVRKGVGALNEDEVDEGMMTTPPFIPGSSPTFPRDTLPTPSVRRGGFGMPNLSPPPSGAMTPPVSMRPTPEAPIEDIPIPPLPGRAGQHQPYSPMAKAKYDYVMRGATKEPGAPGEAPRDVFKRSFKDIALNAVLGGLQSAASGGGWGGAAGGALAAGAGTAINPMMGREYQFETLHRPHMEREEERARTGRMQRYEEALAKGRVDALPRDAERDIAQTEHIRTQNQVAIENAKRQQAETESRIKLNAARTEAAKTGQPKYEDILNPETGVIEKVAVYPNGDTWVVGPSGRAAMNKANITSREKISDERNKTQLKAVDRQQSGATGRTAMTQSGADRRQAARLAVQGQGGAGQSKLKNPNAPSSQSSGKTVSGADEDARAKKAGKDPAAWRKFLQKKGYTIKD